MRCCFVLLLVCANLGAGTPIFVRRDIARLGAKRIAGCVLDRTKLATWGDRWPMTEIYSF